MNNSEGDLLLYATEDGGEINVTNDFFEMTGGFDTAIYFTLFGGNELDDGTESTKKFQYWGNLIDKDNPERQLTSRTQNIIKGLPATSSNLLKLEEAIRLDMQWFKDEKIIDMLNITTSIPSKNRVTILIEGLKNKTQLFNLKYEKNWLASIT